MAKSPGGPLHGKVMSAPRAMGTTNGIDLSPDGKTLYVARILKGTIALMKPTGAVEREIALKGKEPTNLAFGGSDGKTVFVTQRQGGFIESFRTDQQGREHCLQRGRC